MSLNLSNFILLFHDTWVLKLVNLLGCWVLNVVISWVWALGVRWVEYFRVGVGGIWVVKLAFLWSVVRINRNSRIHTLGWVWPFILSAVNGRVSIGLKVNVVSGTWSSIFTSNLHTMTSNIQIDFKCFSFGSPCLIVKKIRRSKLKATVQGWSGNSQLVRMFGYPLTPVLLQSRALSSMQCITASRTSMRTYMQIRMLLHAVQRYTEPRLSPADPPPLSLSALETSFLTIPKQFLSWHRPPFSK